MSAAEHTAPKVDDPKVSAIVEAAERDQFLTLIAALGTLKLTEIIGAHHACRVTHRSTWFRHQQVLRRFGMDLPPKPTDSTWFGGAK